MSAEVVLGEFHEFLWGRGRSFWEELRVDMATKLLDTYFIKARPGGFYELLDSCSCEVYCQDHHLFAYSRMG